MKKKRKPVLLILLLIAVSIYVVILKFPELMKVVYPLYFEEYIFEYSYEYDIDPPLLAAVIKTESNFNPLAESNKGARGLMQITPSTGKWIAEQLNINNYNDDMLFDPHTNIRFGSWYINYLYSHYEKDFDLIFAAYNGGLGNVDKWLKDKSLSSNGRTLETIPFAETSNFVKRIKSNYKTYKKLYKWNNNKEPM